MAGAGALRIVAAAALLAALAACGSKVVREPLPNAPRPAAPPQDNSLPLDATNVETDDLVAATRAALAATRSADAQDVDAQDDADAGARSAAAPATATGRTGISAENDFEAVEEVRGIEDDAELLELNRNRYLQVPPGQNPLRPRRLTANVVQYALDTWHPVGVARHRRPQGLRDAAARAERACARYVTEDLAQEAFLQEGGPEQDRRGLDPDGDGYACGWDPGVYRRIVAN